MDLRHTLRYLGAPLREKSYMFGDNESATRPHSRLRKRHTALSFHMVREAVAAGNVGFYHFLGALNLADILSKHWAYGTTAGLVLLGRRYSGYTRKEGKVVLCITLSGWVVLEINTDCVFHISGWKSHSKEV